MYTDLIDPLMALMLGLAVVHLVLRLRRHLRNQPKRRDRL
jgi:hypothetical protein